MTLGQASAATAGSVYSQHLTGRMLVTTSSVIQYHMKCYWVDNSSPLHVYCGVGHIGCQHRRPSAFTSKLKQGLPTLSMIVCMVREVEIFGLRAFLVGACTGGVPHCLPTPSRCTVLLFHWTSSFTSLCVGGRGGMRCCMHCSDLLKDLHPVCLLCGVHVCMSMHVEGVQYGGGSTVWWREYSVVEVKVYLTSICYRTGLVFCYSRYLEWCVTTHSWTIWEATPLHNHTTGFSLTI